MELLPVYKGVISRVRFPRPVTDSGGRCQTDGRMFEGVERKKKKKTVVCSSATENSES